MSAAALQWRKEIRELLPWWSAVFAGILATWALMHPDAMPLDALYEWARGFERRELFLIGVCIYTAGAIILGALAFGHEYSHRTLASLLAHPIGRTRLLTMKLGSLALLLGSLGTVGYLTWGRDPQLIAAHQWDGLALITALPLLAAFCLAPWFSMVCRGTIGGAVLTVALPVIVWLVVGYFHAPPLPGVIVVLAVSGVAMTWRTFHRLEVADGHQAEVDMVKWLAPSAASLQSRTQNPVWLQVKKELRLQQGTFIISAIYLGLCAVILLFQQGRFAGIGPHDLFPVVFLNSFLVPVIAGACSSAEERRLVTADWHLLLPASARRQWAVKAGVAMALTFLLVIVPAQIFDAMSPGNLLRDGVEAATAMVLCVAAIYVSSLSTSAMRAVVITGPAIVAAVWFAVSVLWPITSAFRDSMNSVGRALRPVIAMSSEARSLVAYTVVAEATGLSLLLLALAYTNHRTVDRSPWRIARQLGWLSLYWVGANLLSFLVYGLIPNSR